MNPHRRPSWLILLALSLLVLPLTAVARPASPGVFVTTITVDSGTDPDNSKAKTCLSDTPCTLRRAIVQARALAPAERPVLIDFNIPATPEEGYDSSLGIWRIEPLSGPDPAIFRALEGGDITIDGTAQPNGRVSGPKIFIVGPGTGSKDCLLVGVNSAGGHDGNTVTGLAFQNFKNHVIVNSNLNVINENWFGLSADGQLPYLRGNNPQDGSGSSGVALSAGVTGNLIVNNVFLGFDGVAAALRGDFNDFSDNFVGTNAEGLLPETQTDPDLICTKVDWLGGGGISLEGEGHSITGNLFAGLRQEIFSSSTQPDAIRVTGIGHVVDNNQIGVDIKGKQVGVCGRGIYMSDSPKGVLLSDNLIVNPGLSAISLNGPLYDANELRGNTILQQFPWTEVEGNPEPEDAIQLGPRLPESLQTFAPARVLTIQGTQASGSSGAGSPCPNCTVELFLDDKDAIVEALASWALVEADAQGNWQATLPRELKPNEGLRTTSTSRKFNTIPGLSAATTTGLSPLYVAQRPPYYLPLVLAK